ncbi:beta-ketoacyl-ACP synthase III [Pedobacter antarcticus]|uniref:Beta-ketoacyl-[acyl-carrier-protein] synthase III n=2 Tax=Pedobacter antarcticus TaxID=34086 RepID=A0A081PDP6_9SPHI|nr:beta-ketoacyl-ACP synthase III [Pedobacter antarcticus]KEQ28819.1 3-oxoacyl-ACP synthase [Pedobacter antarcticus 4BY]SDL36679.1 3-oxoacyl-[acyl-carrier-protein] synthase-3 [Pedobacter antarcticus]SFE48875.1 3-oxoacyl-[acyl-carrier-protein] synthase-3 [Pedobacter antarcticus]
MRKRYNAVITALGGYVPETILSNHDLEKMVDTNNEWIISRTGIQERRILNDDSLATSDLATLAVKRLLEDNHVNPEEIECVIVATATPDYIMVSTASIVCEKAGLTKAWGVDSNSACSGFLYALTLGASLIESDRYKNVIVIGADANSTIVNYEDRNTCILFGDGAGAVLLEQTEEEVGLIDNVFKTDGSGKEHLIVTAGGSLHPSSPETLNQKLNYISQNGRIVFKAAIEGMTQTCTEVLERNGLDTADVNWLIPHQANLRIIHAVGDKLGLREDQVKVNIQRYGNTTAATIPLCMWEFQKDFKENDTLLLTAFGAGFSWGASYLKWGKLRK